MKIMKLIFLIFWKHRNDKHDLWKKWNNKNDNIQQQEKVFFRLEENYKIKTSAN